jgi:tRNA nucleotidyltransferase/poly(A) polymerase
MLEQARRVLEGEEAWIVGGAVRDEALGRPVVDLDIACREPEQAARRFSKLTRGAPFPLSERHGAWRVALEDGRTVDFTPLHDGIGDDLATRDFTINAVARPLGGGEPADPFGGLGDLERRVLRAVGATIFRDDPLRLLRAVRIEDELGFRLDDETAELVRRDASLAARPAGERILAELMRLTAAGYERLDELGLLAPLGGSLERLGGLGESSPEMRLVAVFGRGLQQLPVSNELRRYASALLRAELPGDLSARSVFRFRRDTEPWAVDAARFTGGGEELERAIEQARAADPAEPLLRGDELGLPPGPEIGRLLARLEEERAAGTISTRDEALELVRREAASSASAPEVTDS